MRLALIALVILVGAVPMEGHRRRWQRSHDSDEMNSEEFPLRTTYVQKAPSLQMKMFENVDADDDGWLTKEEREGLMVITHRMLSDVAYNRIVPNTGEGLVGRWNMSDFIHFTDLLSHKVFHPEDYRADATGKAIRQSAHNMRKEIDLVHKRMETGTGHWELHAPHANITVKLAKDLMTEYNWRGEQINMLDKDDDYMVSIYELWAYMEKFFPIVDHVFFWNTYFRQSNSVGQLDGREESLQGVIYRVVEKCKRIFGLKYDSDCDPIRRAIIFTPTDFEWNKDHLDDYEIYELANVVLYDQVPPFSREEIEEQKHRSRHH